MNKTVISAINSVIIYLNCESEVITNNTMKISWHNRQIFLLIDAKFVATSADRHILIEAIPIKNRTQLIIGLTKAIVQWQCKKGVYSDEYMV